MRFLIAGGDADPNLAILAQSVHDQGIGLTNILIGEGVTPCFDWDINSNTLRVNGTLVQPDGAFIRHDVFRQMADARPEVPSTAMGWYGSVYGWLLANPEIRMLNRHISPLASVKPAALWLAQQIGLTIPKTRLLNDQMALSQLSGEASIAKPVNGGGYCLALPDALSQTEFRNGVSAMPALVQEKLVPPEVRVYIIGPSSVAFEMRSEALDYRVDQAVEVSEIPVPRVADLLRVLMDRLQMDFGAADFKTDSKTGELVFLELNTSPMFARFDYESQGKITNAMIDYLVRN